MSKMTPKKAAWYNRRAKMHYADTTIAGLLGHAQRGVTSRYIHAVDKALIVAANDVSMKIREWLDGETE